MFSLVWPAVATSSSSTADGAYDACSIHSLRMEMGDCHVLSVSFIMYERECIGVASEDLVLVDTLVQGLNSCRGDLLALNG